MRAGVAFVLLMACGGSAPPQAAPITNASAPMPATAGPTLTLVVVANGQEIWMGNDDIEPAVDDADQPNPAHYPGFLKEWQAAVTEVPLATLGNERSRAAYVTYADVSKVVRPLGPLATFDGAAFGTQRDYYTKVGTNLVQGVEAGFALFEGSAGKRAMIVLGDGNDTNNDAARGQLVELKKRAAQDAVELYALRWIGPLSDPSEVLSKLVPSKRISIVTSPTQIAEALRAIRDDLHAPSP